MVLILDGNSEIGVQIRSNLFDFIFVIHLIRYQEQSQNVFFSSETSYNASCVRNMF